MDTDRTERSAEMKNAIRPVPASEPGALDGFAWTCPKCEMEISYSLLSLTTAEAREHLRWHEQARAEREHEGRVS